MPVELAQCLALMVIVEKENALFSKAVVVF